MYIVARIYFETGNSVFMNENKIHKISVFCICKRATELKSKE